MRYCKRCDKHKDENQFNKNRSRIDGLAYYCKECNKGFINKENDKVYYYTVRKKNKEKLRAKWAVRNALKRGTLKKEACFLCGSSDFIEAHHYNYSKQLDVYWLCRGCHAYIHRLLKAKNKEDL